MKIRNQILLAAALTAFVSSYATVTRDANGWTQITPSADSRLVYVSNAGSDSNDGLSSSTPKATIGAANALIRDGYPDHLLLRRGDTFTFTSGLGAWKNGRSASEPMVLSYYGTSGARPVIKITGGFLDHGGSVRNYQVFKGLDIYKSNSDPASGDFTGASSQTALRFVGGGANLRIEDCRLRFVEMTIQSYGSGTYTNVEVRRNIVLDAWTANSFTTDAKIMGMYVSGVNGYLIEENFFDHNGWNETVSNAGANQFNHNIYVQYDNKAGGIMRGNIFTRGAAHGLQARSGGEVDRNLFALNAVAVNMGGNGEPTDPAVETWPNYVHDNVILNGRLMSTVNSNYPRTSAVWGVWEDSYIQGASIDGNIVANRIDSGSNSSYNGIENMDFGTNISYSWDPSLDTTNPSWPHPGDDLGDYNASIGGTNSTTAYLTTLRNRAVGDLPWNLTAYAAINYIRAGFLMSPVSGVYSYPGSGGGPVVTITASDASAGEPSNNGQFTVTASPAPSSPLVVNLSRSGTATNGSDYSSVPTTVTVPTSGSVTIPVNVIDDQLFESSETVILTVASGSGYSVGSPSAATVTITSDDTGVVASAGAGFQNTAIASQTGSFVATFYATPSVSLINSVIGFASTAPADYPDLAANVRFSPSGVIDARNGSAYQAGATVNYSGGQTYFIRMVVNVPAKTYSVFVTPPGGSEITLASNYAFRSEQSGVTSLNYRTVQVLDPAGSAMNVANVTIAPIPTITVTANDAAAGEPSNNGQFTVTAIPAPAAPITVNVTVTGTATNGSDYTTIPATVNVGTSGTATVNVTVTDDSTVENSETAILTIAAGSGYVVGTPNSATVTITDNDTGALPSPWVTQDIGAVGATGTASHSSGTFTVAGSGVDIWGTTDEFRYVYQAASGDCTIVARVVSVQNTDTWAKAGVMIRDTTGATSAYADVVVTPGSNAIMFERRASSGANATQTVNTGFGAPYWIRVVRTGNTFTASRSSNGTSWTTIGSQSITMGTNVTIGLAVTSHNDGTLCTAVFDNVSVTP